MRGLWLALTMAWIGAGALGAQSAELSVAGYFVPSSDPRSVVFLVIENHTPWRITDLQFLGFETPGFAKSGSCWYRIGDREQPGCRPESLDPPHAEAMPPLAVGETIVVSAEVAREAPGKHQFTGLLSWREHSPGTEPRGVERRKQVFVATVKSEQRWSDFRLGSVDDVVGLLDLLSKLLWPILGFLLGVLFNRGAERRAAQQQTWSQMLAKSHENAERYYMPASSAVFSFLRRIERGSSDEGFFYLALFLRRMHVLVSDIGGFYFKDRLSEDIVHHLWTYFRDRCRDEFKEEGRDALIKFTHERDTFRDFSERLNPKGAWNAAVPVARVQALQTPFRGWFISGKPGLDLAVLEAIEVVFDFAMNQPYELWYGRKERLDDEKVLLIEEKLRSLAGSLGNSKETKRIEDIAAKIRKLRRTFGPGAFRRGIRTLKRGCGLDS